MKALLAFSSGGGSGFPGSPVAGVYAAGTAPEFLSVCATVLAVQYSIVVDAAGGLLWYSDGSQMILLGGTVLDSSGYPSPGTQGGIVFSIPSTVAIYNNDSGQFVYFDGTDWQALFGN